MRPRIGPLFSKRYHKTAYNNKDNYTGDAFTNAGAPIFKCHKNLHLVVGHYLALRQESQIAMRDVVHYNRCVSPWPVNENVITFEHRGIVRPVKRDWAVLSKDTPMDISM